MPIPLIALILAGVATLAVIAVVIAHYDDIIAWFQERNDLKVGDKDNIAFSLKQNMENGKYKVIHGIFNTRSDSIIDGRVVQAKSLDRKLTEAHYNNELVLYK